MRDGRGHAEGGHR